MVPLKPQNTPNTNAHIDPWDPNSATLAVMRIREIAVNIVGDPIESVTYTMPAPRVRQSAPQKFKLHT